MNSIKDSNKRSFSGPNSSNSEDNDVVTSDLICDDVKSNFFNCSVCEQPLSTKGNLKRHYKRCHPNHDMPQQERKKLNFSCYVCQRQFSKDFHLKYHLKTDHLILIPSEAKYLKCSFCKEDIVEDSFLTHHEEQHDIKIEKESLTFQNFQEFEIWKKNLEMESCCKFNLERTQYCNKNKYSYYVCHRSGNFVSKSQGKRRVKSKGSYKTSFKCPAKINVVLSENRCDVIYVKTHLGHKNDLKHISLSSTEREAIAQKIAAKIPFNHILDEIRDGISESGLGRVHLLEKQDLYNIESSYNLSPNVVRHKDDGTSVDAWVKEMEASGADQSCILFYKPQGSINPVYPTLSKEDFVLMIMNNAQAEMLKSFGSDCVCIDGTHGTNSYDFELVTLLVIDEIRQSFPVAFLISSKIDTSILSIFFSCIKNKVGKIYPKVFMSDMAENFYTAWITEMKIPDKRLYCSWHVDNAWRKNIMSKVKGKEKRAEVYKIIRILMEELDKTAFESMLQEALYSFLQDPNTVEFGKYFDTYYAKCVSSWAYCYRLHAGINTNMHIERMHRTLKYIYFEGKNVKRLDKAICATMKFVRDKIVERFIVKNKGKLSSKIKNIRKRHTLSLGLNLNIIEVEKDTHWSISSSSGPGMYDIRKLSSQCECQLLCTECNICMHAFTCSCMDSAIKWNLCKHIHFLQQYLISQDKASLQIDNCSQASLQIDMEENFPNEDILISELAKFNNPCTSSDKNIEQNKEAIKSLFLNILESAKTSEECDAIKRMVVSLKPTLAALNSNPTIQNKVTKINKKYITPQRRLFSLKKKRKVPTKRMVRPTENQSQQIAASLLLNKAKRQKLSIHKYEEK